MSSPRIMTVMVVRCNTCQMCLWNFEFANTASGVNATVQPDVALPPHLANLGPSTIEDATSFEGEVLLINYTTSQPCSVCAWESSNQNSETPNNPNVTSNTAVNVPNEATETPNGASETAYGSSVASLEDRNVPVDNSNGLLDVNERHQADDEAPLNLNGQATPANGGDDENQRNS